MLQVQSVLMEIFVRYVNLGQKFDVLERVIQIGGCYDAELLGIWKEMRFEKYEVEYLLCIVDRILLMENLGRYLF